MGYKYTLEIWTPSIQIGEYEYVVTYSGQSLWGLARALWRSREAKGYARRIVLR